MSSPSLSLLDLRSRSFMIIKKTRFCRYVRRSSFLTSRSEIPSEGGLNEEEDCDIDAVADVIEVVKTSSSPNREDSAIVVDFGVVNKNED